MEHRIKIQLADSNQVWKNRNEVIKKLYSAAVDDTVIIDTLFEGISLQEYGVAGVIDTWVAETNRDPVTVKIDTPNQIENIGYQFYSKKLRSHFFKASKINYHADPQTLMPAEKLFGYFVGKYTADRNRIALDILQLYRDKFLMSVMIDTDAANKWDKDVYAIGSLDGCSMTDQWLPEYNTNQSLLQFYNQFEIELVAETFVYGQTFFPTEKTIRPIMGSKPFLIYGPRNFLENLKNLGFETFEEIWSEEYDQYEGVERWECMKQIIDALHKNAYYHQDEYTCKQIQRIVKYNYNHLQNILEYGSTLY